jgi:hypothetical protein
MTAAKNMEGLGVTSVTLGNARTKPFLVALATLLVLGQCYNPLEYAGDMGGGTYDAVGLQMRPQDAEHKFNTCRYGVAGGKYNASLSDIMTQGNVLVIMKATVDCAFCRRGAPNYASFARRIVGPDECVS